MYSILRNLSIFKLNVLGSRWLMTFRKAQVHISAAHWLCAALCSAPRPVSSPTRCLPPFPFVLPLLSGQPPCCARLCLFLFVALFYIPHEWTHMTLVLFHRTYFAHHDTLAVHPCCHKWQSFIHPYGCVVFHWMHAPHRLYSVTHLRTLGSSPCLGYSE